ncbi:MAG: nucleoside 2-deoxyribosyltransferase [Nocardioides sp.]|uniref:nucleoside 2-deoxyribosyltransferase n=1 Tax=Nocardioides sp. TaxID=35761 RepID=UPI003D6A211C
MKHLPNSHRHTYYFAGSIRGGREDVARYQEIIEWLKVSGDVLTEHVGDYSLSLKGQTHFDDTFIHDRDLSWLRQADCVVAETTHTSLGVGYEIAMAATYQIPVFALHRPDKSSLSAMIGGCASVTVLEYDEVADGLEQLEKVMSERLRAA